jgi:hypothetical protein
MPVVTAIAGITLQLIIATRSKMLLGSDVVVTAQTPRMHGIYFGLCWNNTQHSTATNLLKLSRNLVCLARFTTSHSIECRTGKID